MDMHRGWYVLITNCWKPTILLWFGYIGFIWRWGRKVLKESGYSREFGDLDKSWDGWRMNGDSWKRMTLIWYDGNDRWFSLFSGAVSWRSMGFRVKGGEKWLGRKVGNEEKKMITQTTTDTLKSRERVKMREWRVRVVSNEWVTIA